MIDLHENIEFIYLHRQIQSFSWITRKSAVFRSFPLTFVQIDTTNKLTTDSDKLLHWTDQRMHSIWIAKFKFKKKQK